MATATAPAFGWIGYFLCGMEYCGFRPIASNCVAIA
jgi:hypothetical protein